MPKIRRFNPEKDLLNVAGLANQALGEDYKLSMFTNVFNLWPDGFLVADSMDQHMGALVAIMSEPTTARILVLAVEESFRRQGIAQQLLSSFIQKAVIAGVKKITLEVRMSNKIAIKFYEKNRFKIVSTIPVYYKDGESAFVMERFL
jgi:ribosomal-protein-alanine N-acetyltransferase